MSKIDQFRNNNIACRCNYHIVWCPKYRRKIITREVETRLKEIIHEVCYERDAYIIELETMPDQIHLLVSVDPQYGIHRLVKQTKGGSSQLLRQETPSVESRPPKLCAYCLTAFSAMPPTVATK